MEWILVSERKPPEHRPVLVWSPMHGMMAVTYNYFPAWKPFDETLLEGLMGKARELVESLRRLNEIGRGQPARESWCCVCEDSYWPIDEFTHWCEMPEPPMNPRGTPCAK